MTPNAHHYVQNISRTKSDMFSHVGYTFFRSSRLLFFRKWVIENCNSSNFRLVERDWSLRTRRHESIVLEVRAAGIRMSSATFNPTEPASCHMFDSKLRKIDWTLFELLASITMITHDSATENAARDLPNLAQTNQSLWKLNTCYEETCLNGAVIPRWICAESVLKPRHLSCHV